MNESSDLPASVVRFLEAARGLGLAVEPRLLDDSARTAAEAAAALGCSVAEIAKSIVFRRTSDDAAVIVVTSGDQRVDPTRVRDLAGDVGRADADFVRAATGFAIGGVPPLGHEKPCLVLVDRSLERFEQVWAAAGHGHAVFPVSPHQLRAVLGADGVDVSVSVQ